MEGVPSHKQLFLLINSRYISAQIGHHKAILEEYTDGDGIFINYNARVKLLLVKIMSDSA
jgi:hypothetical protein